MSTATKSKIYTVLSNTVVVGSIPTRSFTRMCSAGGRVGNAHFEDRVCEHISQRTKEDEKMSNDNNFPLLKTDEYTALFVNSLEQPAYKRHEHVYRYVETTKQFQTLYTHFYKQNVNGFIINHPIFVWEDIDVPDQYVTSAKNAISTQFLYVNCSHMETTNVTVVFQQRVQR